MEKTNLEAENSHQDLSSLPMKERLAKWREQKGKTTKVPTTKSALHPKPVNSTFQKPSANLPPQKNVRSTQPRIASKTSATSLSSKPTSSKATSTTNASLTKSVRTIETGKEQQATRVPQDVKPLSSDLTTVATPRKPAVSDTFIFESPSSSTSSPRFGTSTMTDLQDDLFRLLDEKENETTRGKATGNAKMVATATSAHEKRIRELESELQCKRRAIESLTVQASTERSELISQHAADKQAYERTIRDAENVITDLRNQLDSNRTQLLRVTKEQTSSLQQMASLQLLVSEKETQIVNLTSRLQESFEQRVPKLELDIAIEDRNHMAKELEETKGLLEECKACLQVMDLREARILELEAEFVRKGDIIEELERQLELSRTNAARLTEEEARAAELQTAVEDLIEENDMLHAQNKKLMDENVCRGQQLEQLETVGSIPKHDDAVHRPTADETKTENPQTVRESPSKKILKPITRHEPTTSSRGVQTDIQLEKLLEESHAAINRYRMIQAENCIIVQQMNQNRKKYDADLKAALSCHLSPSKNGG